MPILLTTPHTYDPGHGKPTVDYALVIIETMAMHATSKRLVLGLLYFNLNPTTGAIEPSPERMLTVTIENKPEVVDRQQRINPETGIAEIEDVEISPEDNAFDAMQTAFTIRVNAGVLEVDGVSAVWGAEARGYDFVSTFLYQYLIDHDYYEGTIV